MATDKLKPSPAAACARCGVAQHADQMVQCRRCRTKFHAYCLVPPLTAPPTGDFFCANCASQATPNPNPNLAPAPASTPAPTQKSGAKQQVPPSATASAPTPVLVRDASGRVIAVPRTELQECKSRGVVRIQTAALATTPFLARLWKDSQYVQLGLYATEREAAQTYERAAVQAFGRTVQPKYPVPGSSGPPATTATTAAAASAAPHTGANATARSRARPRASRAKAGTGGRSKRKSEEGHGHGHAHSSTKAETPIKKRKTAAVAAATATPAAPTVSAPRTSNFLGVEVFPGYAHAQINVDDKMVNLGTFSSAEEAALAYDKAALHYFGGPLDGPEAHYDRVVINFPARRAELVQQLRLEQSTASKTQAIVPGSMATALTTSATRSMQSAKHHLSMNKLETWMAKMQRAAKLVEVAQRVQWDGVTALKVKTEQTTEDDSNDDNAAFLRAGPKIKTEFTRKQQRLRTDVSQMEDAVQLMIEELKLYADSPPEDDSFQGAPRSGVLLDLVSSSRYLKLCSTINELAQLNINAAKSHHDGSFERLLQTVVDHRVRLRMAAAGEKSKLATLVEDDQASESATPSKVPTSIHDELAQKILKRAKYVRREVPRKHQNFKAIKDEDTKEQKEEETKPQNSEDLPALTAPEPSKESGTSDEVVESSANDAVQDGASSGKPVENEDSSDVIEAAKEERTEATESNDAEDKETSKGDNDEQKEEGRKEIEDMDAKEGNENKQTALADEGAHQEADDKESEATKAVEDTHADTSNEEMKVKEDGADGDVTMETTEEDTQKQNDDDESKVDKTDEDVTMAEPDKASSNAAVEEIVTTAEPDKASSNAAVEEIVTTQVATTEAEPTAEPAGESTSDSNAEPTAESAAADIIDAAKKEDEDENALALAVSEPEYEICLAVPLPLDGEPNETSEWRLLPLNDATGVFIDGVVLSDEEVRTMEVSIEQVCTSDSAEVEETKSKRWLPHLNAVHREEARLHDQFRKETKAHRELKSVLHSQQTRLNAALVKCRGALDVILSRSRQTTQQHSRLTRDRKLIEVMSDAFAPIMENLRDECEHVFFSLLERLAVRFTDFEEEFNYYTNALQSVSTATGADIKADPSSMKEEPVDVAACNPTEEESGLLQTYTSFYLDEIETLWKERCSVVEGLHAILRTLSMDLEKAKTKSITAEPQTEGEPVVESEDVDVSACVPSPIQVRVQASYEQWKAISWPSQLDSQPHAPFHRDAMSSGEEAQGDLVTTMNELHQVIIDLTQEAAAAPSPPLRPTTLVVYHPMFTDHQTPRHHPECPDRLSRIISVLNLLRKKHEAALSIERLTQTPDELSPPEEILLAVHSPAYLRQLRERSLEAAAASSTSSNTSRSASNVSLVFETNRPVADPGDAASKPSLPPTTPVGGAFGATDFSFSGITLDTYVSAKSWDVARAAAGTVCLAVDRVLRQEFRHAVCIVRPPGHHAGSHGRTEHAPSSGFCLLNNVVIGAVHARQYPWIQRIAVIDWDIHHGNGTQELLQGDPSAFFASVHLYASGKFFPGTGVTSQYDNVLNVPLQDSGEGSGSAAFRSALQDQILPAIRTFHPDLIFISAGFDGHRDDLLGGRAAVKTPGVPAGYVEEDYVWATQQVLQLADECCEGRVVSVLEGGYDVRKETNALAKSVAAHVSAIAVYEHERELSGAAAADQEVLADAEHVKRETLGGILQRLLAKNLDDDDVVLIDDEAEDEDGASTTKSPVVITAAAAIAAANEEADVEASAEDDGVEDMETGEDGEPEADNAESDADEQNSILDSADDVMLLDEDENGTALTDESADDASGVLLDEDEEDANADEDGDEDDGDDAGEHSTEEHAPDDDAELLGDL